MLLLLKRNETQCNKTLIFLGSNHTYLQMMDDLKTVLEENFFVIQMKAVTEPAKQLRMLK